MGSIAVAQLPATNAAEQRLCRAFWWHRRAVLAGGGVLPHVAVPAVSSVVLIVSCVFLATITQQPGQRAAQLPSLRQTSAAPGQASSHAVFISVWQCAIAARPPGSSCRLHGLAGRSAGRQRRRAGGSSCNALHGDCKTTWWDARAARSPHPSSRAASSAMHVVPPWLHSSLVQLKTRAPGNWRTQKFRSARPQGNMVNPAVKGLVLGVGGAAGLYVASVSSENHMGRRVQGCSDLWRRQDR